MKIKEVEEYAFGIAKLKVASLDDLFRMKIEAYAERKEARDLFDCVFIMKHKRDFSKLNPIIKKYGLPENIEEVKQLVQDEENYNFFIKSIQV